jgi:hypothetical protein
MPIKYNGLTNDAYSRWSNKDNLAPQNNGLISISYLKQDNKPVLNQKHFRNMG